MASSPTTRLRFQKQGTGDNSGTWGTLLNSGALDLIDEAIAGVTTLTITGSVTLTSSNYASDQARKKVLRLDGSPASGFTVTIPGVEKTYLVHNNTGQTATITTASGPTVATAAIPTTAVKTVYCDGTNVYANSDGIPVTTTGEVLLAGPTSVVAGATTIDLTLSANYAVFRIVLAGIKGSTSATLYARLSMDGSSFLGAGNAYWDSVRSGNQSEISLGSVTTTAALGGTVSVVDPRNAAAYTAVTGTTVGDGAMTQAGGVRRNLESNVAIRLFLSGGATFQGGTVYVFGSKYQ